MKPQPTKHTTLQNMRSVEMPQTGADGIRHLVEEVGRVLQLIAADILQLQQLALFAVHQDVLLETHHRDLALQSLDVLPIRILREDELPPAVEMREPLVLDLLVVKVEVPGDLEDRKLDGLDGGDVDDFGVGVAVVVEVEDDVVALPIVHVFELELLDQLELVLLFVL